jgi:hypothetical protein
VGQDRGDSALPTEWRRGETAGRHLAREHDLRRTVPARHDVLGQLLVAAVDTAARTVDGIIA